MIDQNGPDPMFGKEKDEDDQDIIELTDEVAPEPTAVNDDIIELTSEVEEPAEEADDEEIIELISEAEEPAEEADDEEIIELISEAEEPAGEVIMAFDDEVPEGVDVQLEEATPDATSEMTEDEEDLLNFLSDEPEATTESQPAAPIEEEIPETAAVDDFEFPDPANMDSQTELPQKDIELASVMGIELDPARDLSLEPQGDDIEVELDELGRNQSSEMPTFIIPLPLLEAAIERVVGTKLSEKIDRLLTAAIEKAVTTEISRLKRLLTDDLSDD